MMVLISGSNGSGKSLFAEKLAATAELPRYYIATMVSQSKENDQRIEKHRRQRAGLGFTTFEIPCHVGQAEVPPDSLVLLEDASNLLANLVFTEQGTVRDALDEIEALRDKCRYLIVVTISGLDETAYDGETADYIRSMEQLNEHLLSMADAAVELVNGKPVMRKGDPYDLL